MNNLQPDDHAATAERDRRWTEHLIAREELRHELKQTKANAALVVHALTCAIQLTEVLLAFYPENSQLHPEFAAAKNALDEALTAIGVRKP
jgi:hypothetical protein